jgi:flagellar M-ring protein FliF
MRELLKKVLTQIKNLYSKLNTRQKIILGVIILLVIASFVFLISYSGKATKVILYSNLNAKDFGEITKKLQEWGYDFKPEENNIWVKPEDKQYIKMKLAQEGIIPEGIKGWELFDIQKWTTTDFERNINKRRIVYVVTRGTLKLYL